MFVRNRFPSHTFGPFIYTLDRIFSCLYTVLLWFQNALKTIAEAGKEDKDERERGYKTNCSVLFSFFF